MRIETEIIVIGGGHAGAEAAWAAANLGADVALVTLRPETIGVMSCNPAVGGLAKGQIVREIDAMGGLMGLAADAAGIMFKTLNTSRGPAVRGPRAQCDKHAYAETVHSMLRSRERIRILGAAVESFIIEDGSIRGVRAEETAAGRAIELRAGAVVLTTGTFMRGLMHTGDRQTPGGRSGEAPSLGLTDTLSRLGFELGRLKTGTPPRLRRDTIDWEALEPQHGDDPPTPFSDLTDPTRFPRLEQVDCRITRTTPESHELIRANLHRAPMYNGQIDVAGPRYCPSIEDKIVRFPDRESHHVFLEPESHRDDSVYCNGVSTSLPEDVQRRIVGAMPGCENAEILRLGYAVEYDMVRPHQIDATCMTKSIPGLFLAGQINGTTGYEEAAAQGLIAGINAVRHARAHDPVTLARDEAYIGVLMDDLVTKTPTEPYRMFTSRAEHRLLLRADNAADRLTPIARELEAVDDHRWSLFQTRRARIDQLNTAIDAARVGDEPLSLIVRRANFTTADLRALLETDAPDAVIATVLAERQYAGYIERQRAEIKRHAAMDRRRIPSSVDYDTLPGLRAEARETLKRFRPATIGQAGRLAGVNPADVSIILVEMRRRSDRRPAARATA